MDNYRCLLPLQIPFGYDFSVRQLSGRCGFSFEELIFRLLLHLDSLDVSLVEILFRILSNLLHVEVGAVEGITALVCCCSETAMRQSYGAVLNYISHMKCLANS